MGDDELGCRVVHMVEMFTGSLDLGPRDANLLRSGAARDLVLRPRVEEQVLEGCIHVPSTDFLLFLRMRWFYLRLQALKFFFARLSRSGHRPSV